VAVPLRWEELTGSKSGGAYDLRAARQRAERLARNPWGRFARLQQVLP